MNIRMVIFFMNGAPFLMLCRMIVFIIANIRFFVKPSARNSLICGKRYGTLEKEKKKRTVQTQEARKTMTEQRKNDLFPLPGVVLALAAGMMLLGAFLEQMRTGDLHQKMHHNWLEFVIAFAEMALPALYCLTCKCKKNARASYVMLFGFFAAVHFFYACTYLVEKVHTVSFHTVHALMAFAAFLLCLGKCRMRLKPERKTGGVILVLFAFLLVCDVWYLLSSAPYADAILEHASSLMGCTGLLMMFLQENRFVFRKSQTETA